MTENGIAPLGKEDKMSTTEEAAQEQKDIGVNYGHLAWCNAVAAGEAGICGMIFAAILLVLMHFSGTQMLKDANAFFWGFTILCVILGAVFLGPYVVIQELQEERRMEQRWPKYLPRPWW